MLFSGCSSLTYLPDISKWDTKNIINMRGIFFNCLSLTFSRYIKMEYKQCF